MVYGHKKTHGLYPVSGKKTKEID
ncbi:uncharacterized protein G2W53_033715 [Senna tora]|uniref:Uncharacterized protein n=1 Tax=Senna tora TaxID=362788 RepID=A0A834SZ49_9FABA|nr:uncharacterized protein G2W53_033715 [Senna tora]